MAPGNKSGKGKQKIIVTSALPYVNNIPHLGNLVCVISADIYSRFLKLKGENAVYVLGTDEHGTTAEVKALEEGLSVRELVDKYFKIHTEIYTWFNCRPDCYGRTSSEENKEITQDIFAKLDKNGYIVEQELEQLYDEKAGKFLADRFVEGECPQCGFERARGDQCDKCCNLMEPTQLINPISKISGTTPVLKKSTHLFIDLEKLQPKLEQWIGSVKSKWTDNARTTTEGWLNKGLQLRCITRDLKWGIPVNKKGFENKVFYSWFDAPIGYIGITAEHKNDWKKWWLDKDAKHTRLVQFMGKDNIPFHTILFPAFLIGTNDPYALVDTLSVNEYLNYEDGKFSKSEQRGVFGDSAKETGIPADVWRFYLTAIRPEKTDTLFAWSDFQEKTNFELIGNFANLVNRTLTFINKFFDSKVYETNDKLDYKQDLKEIESLYDQIELRKALKKILELSSIGNRYFQAKEPWKTKDSDIDDAKNTLAKLFNLVKDLCILIKPIMPDTAAEIEKQLNLKDLSWKDLGKDIANHKIGEPVILFNKLEDKRIKELQQKFSGKTAEDKKAGSAEKADIAKESDKAEDKNKRAVADDFSALNLKIAKIVEVKDHPEADKLYCFTIDLGDHQRSLVAGIRPYYKKEELLNRNIIIVSNLKPANLRGVRSEGMLLGSGRPFRLLEAPKSRPGEQVFVDGYAVNEHQIDISKFSKVEMHARDGCAWYKDKKLKTQTEEISIEKGVEGRLE
ncbi:MAG: methionine--tRNA ligase [Candidatus Woesearchaeota archaeon]